MAARAHDAAAIAIKGSSAFLNFPDLAQQLPRAASNSPKDIQVAAAKAAELVVSSRVADQLGSDVEGSPHDIIDDEAFLDLPDLFSGISGRYQLDGLFCASAAAEPVGGGEGEFFQEEYLLPWGCG
ncbi:hypothetical protein CDL12_04410 [Handroanthus impetiginosus]|uniref:AP2/ERF domain-containing protein n=1 Tax=Handroanthus impetiginosus TaxID=429701 RepID=A0A2G9HZU9_9LAMI|nr:hypothetical protein CDL12_04410 [Handroanthus impetiginosus]